MSDVAIYAEGIGKRYKVGERQKYKALRDTLANALRAPIRRTAAAFQNDKRTADRSTAERTFWALKDVSFEIKQGEAVGLIGHNGAGKSTLLKVLSRITEPTDGYAQLHGRLGSLLEVGTGFHPELTGRENVFLNGAILGMRKREIERQFEAIVDFADNKDFIDTPVKFYSSGMYVRLAFAVAAHMEPEILLVDEVLAVGDAEFQKKCLGKMQEVGRAGRTVLFVSHNMAAIQGLCSRGLVMQGGRVVTDAPINEAVKAYLDSLAASADSTFEVDDERPADGTVRLTGARALDEFGQPSQHLIAGQPASFELTYSNPAVMNRVDAALQIYNELGVAVTNLNMKMTNLVVTDMAADGRFVCMIPKLPLPIGRYRVSAIIRHGGTELDRAPNAFSFSVESSTFFSGGRTPRMSRGACMVEHSWRHEPGTPTS